MQIRKYQFILSVVLCMPFGLLGNNIQLSNATVKGQNTSTKTANVQFNLSWENSWRTTSAPNNWDAAWVFVKFRVGESDPIFSGVSSSGTTVTVNSTANLRVGMPVVVTSGTGAFAANTVISSITNSTQFVVSATPSTTLSNASITCRRIWEHAALDTTDANHTAPAGSTINAPNDSTGVFIYRSSAGSGTNTWNNVGLRWKYGSNGVADQSFVEVKVFAIEMVYVPQGSFYVGSGGTESGSFTDGSWTSGATIPYQITAEAALGVDNASGKLWGTSQSGDNTIGNAAADPEATIAAAYPKGFAAFYCMKYEISQGQYRDFLNTLTYAQQMSRTATAPSSAPGTAALSNANRNGLDIQTPGVAVTAVPAVYGCNLDGDGNFNESNDGEWIACNWLSWMDGCAFVQWSGLRPMTELEYEKACRGDQAAVSGEYAWGSASITGATGISNGGANNETFSNSGANCVYNNNAGVQGPLRVGAFAGGATTRAQSGGSYYGIMELSGNLWERTVTIGNATGRAFTGLHGNGSLSTAGHATTSAWPGLISGQLTGATGSGFRGGGWADVAALMRVSDRISAASTSTIRNFHYGFRGIRLAP